MPVFRLDAWAALHSLKVVGIQRAALKEWGFDYDGADGVVIASQKIEFGCDVEQTPSL